MNRDTSDKIHIMVVEDENHVRNLVKMYLEMSNFVVIEAENGRQALELLYKKIPSLIITDIMMPEMDGIEFFLNLKESPLFNKIPVIVLTVKSQFEDIKYASLIGVEEYMTKPFDPRELIRKVKAVLNRPRQEKKIF